ncbi:hypothetical protein M3A49_01115 [Paraburkholderia sp. CNPSo 3076]|uniref:hypothetical protein n=1 Tax=Paraburkholderia sp. CNPSo 3076 TaxID=2940936 RepID=UPI00225881ED|nr:hypothetical protein [Paraburkholderia sp. CNPSo 3076]MCX5538109.1 hypothetical protein [Paraburkholderia sp. CNPSo 3076]
MNLRLAESVPASLRAPARRVAFIVLLICSTMKAGLCEQPHVVTVQPGATEELFFQVNLSGNIYVRLGTEDGSEPCADFWWITWPLGTVESLGRHCGFATFSIPGWSKLAVSSKLRVGRTKSVTKIAVFENSSVAHSWKFSF